MTFNLSVILRESARRDPDKTAVIFGDRKVSYAELDAAADRAAAGLLRHASPGDRVALMLPNRVEFLECYFGILKAGLVAVPMNPLLKAAEVAHIVTDSGARVVVGRRPVRRRGHRRAGAEPGPPRLSRRATSRCRGRRPPTPTTPRSSSTRAAPPAGRRAPS